MKVMTIVGTRPELIKLSRVIAKLDEYCNHILVHTGQNYDYELNEVFFEDLEIRRPDYFLNTAAGSPIQTIANVLVESDKLLELSKPDALLIYGDTNSCLAVLAAKRRKIPIFHMEAGNRCFDLRVPEEINRKIVDHLSDVNIALSDQARGYLLAEGLAPERVIKSGSCMKEVLSYYREKINSSKVLERLVLKKGEYIIASIHREENVDSPDNLKAIIESLERLSREFNKKVLVSTHPRTQKRLDHLNLRINDDHKIEFLKPFSFSDYIKIQENAFCVVSDSGTITEESSLLGFPAISIRNTHERPEGMDVGTLIMSGTNPDEIIKSVKIVTAMERPQIVNDYNIEGVSEKIVKIIFSYTHYVNRYVWRKMI